jgi:hypothetical protein
MNINNFKKHVDEDSVEFNANGKGATAEVNEIFLENMMDSDKPECKFKRGDTVYKATYDAGDIHDINTPGVVKGTLFEKTLGEAYLVLFEGDEHMCFTIGKKLKAEL